MTSFTFRPNKKYKFEVSLGLFQCLVSNATIADQMRAFGFVDVSVSVAVRNRVAEGS